jgi:hypothetical protein
MKNQQRQHPAMRKVLPHPGARMLVIGALVISQGFTCLPGLSEDAPKMAEFNNSELSFKMNYPANWEVLKPDGEDFLQVQTNKGAVGVKVMAVPMLATLEEFVNVTLVGFAGKPNYVKTAQENIQLHGMPACKVCFNVKDGETIKVQQVLVLAVHNGRGYVLVCTTTPEFYPAFSGVFDKMAQSIDLSVGKDALAAAVDQALAKMAPYHNADNSFKMNYPSNWVVTKPDPPNFLALQTQAGTVAIRVMSVDMPAPVEEFAKAIVADFAAKPSYVKISQETVQLHGVPASRICYSVNQASGGSTIKEEQMFVLSVKNGKGYGFICTIPQNSYAAFASVFDKMAQSIDLSGK